MEQRKSARVQSPALTTPHLYIPVPLQDAQEIYSAGGAGKLRHRAAFQLWRPALLAQPPTSSLKINYHSFHKHMEIPDPNVPRPPSTLGTYAFQKWCATVPKLGCEKKKACLFLNPDVEVSGTESQTLVPRLPGLNPELYHLVAV